MMELKILKEDIIKWLTVILILLLIPYGSIFLVVIFTFLFFRKKIYNIDLLLLYFLLFFTQNLVGGGEAGLKNIRFLLIFISFFLTVGQRGFSYKSLFRKNSFVPFLFIFLLLHSIIFSYNIANSIVELLSFLLLFLFAFKNTYFENVQQRVRIINDIEAMYIAILLLSIITIAIPSISYAKNGTGFQGVGNHPNTFGVVVAPFCGWALIKLVQRFSLKDLILSVLCLVFLYLTQSRTALLSVFLGIITLMIINKKLRVLISRKTLVLIILSAAFIILNLNSITTSMFNFLDKSKTGSVEESVLLSRGSIIDKQTFNIDKNPLFGIGFKTPSDLIVSENVFSLGKPYEKGNTLLAAVEELGIIGFIILFIAIVLLLKLRINRRSSLLILPLIGLFTTMGEATLFSIGGIGVLIWAFVFLSFHNGILLEKKGKVKKTKKRHY
ncbi:MAG: O-antigen ligase family protein [Flavobacteriales bacterium]|nr:O-antigen ligase family protein [Flavobacteriales bacterium]